MRAFFQLLRSMRFAIAILTVVALASVIGSVLEQNQPMAVYVGRYGEFWTALFTLTGLTDIYHAAWFVGLLGFMALSTGLCLAQHTPAMLREMRSYRESKSLQSLMQLPCSSEMALVNPDSALQERIGAYLRSQRFRFVSRNLQNGGHMLAAHVGGTRRLGYIFVHAAIVLICVGGLVDSNIGLRLAVSSGSIVPETRNLAPADVPARSRLASDSGSFRAILNLNEGGTENAAYLPLNDGYLLQELPFSVRLKRFYVEHYDNGQPKDFASDIEIIDGGTRQNATLKVNHPYTYNGVTFYQSGFGDGGTTLSINALPFENTTQTARIEGRVGGEASLLIGGEPHRVEFTEFRPINVFADESALSTTASKWFLPKGGNGSSGDVGPSLSFRLRDALGQASEWNVFMHPLAIQGANYFVIGRREPPQESMLYVRLPADRDSSVNSYRHFSAAIKQADARRRAASVVASRVQDRDLADAIERSTTALLESFAVKGLRAIAEMVEKDVPDTEQSRAASLYLDLLQGAAAVLLEEPADSDGDVSRFARDCLVAYSDSVDAGIGMYFDLTGFNQVHSSALQVTYAPGAFIVYLGAALLALGTCAMYFVHERRMWIWVMPSLGKMCIGLTANRPLPGLSVEFQTHRAALLNLIHSGR